MSVHAGEQAERDTDDKAEADSGAREYRIPSAVRVGRFVGSELQIWGGKAITVPYDDLGLAPSSLAENVDWYAPDELPYRLQSALWAVNQQ